MTDTDNLTNTLAYYGTVLLTAVRNYHNGVSGVDSTKLLFVTDGVFIIFFIELYKILFAVHSKHSIFCPSADVKPMSQI